MQKHIILDIISILKRRFYLYWNKIYLNLIGVRYGKNLKMYNKVYVHGEGELIIGNDFLFISGNGINPIARNIEGEIFVKRGGMIEIGDRVGISSSTIWAGKRITIGNDVNVGADCIIIDTDAHPHNYLQRRKDYRKKVGNEEYEKLIPSAAITICDDVWLGARCQVLKGVTIGARSIIAAGSIVTKDIPADVIAGGNPCKVIKRLNNYEDNRSNSNI